MVDSAGLSSPPDLLLSFFWRLSTKMGKSFLVEERSGRRRWFGGGLAKEKTRGEMK
jgi:hypothetical protein